MPQEASQRRQSRHLHSTLKINDGGLATAALLARAGHKVTLVEGNEWLGGKSLRIEVAGQRIDTGPSLVTFPGVWQQILETWDSLGDGPSAETIAGVKLERLPEVGRYYFRGQAANLPVEEGHPWHAAWQKFQHEHGGLGEAITTLLTKDPWDPGILGAGKELLKRYGTRLTTKSYLDGLDWMPHDLKDVISIHTLKRAFFYFFCQRCFKTGILPNVFCFFL